MACGSCGGKASAQKRVVRPSNRTNKAATPAGTQRAYDVVGPDGSLVASHSNLVAARAEARRSSGTVVPRSV